MDLRGHIDTVLIAHPLYIEGTVGSVKGGVGMEEMGKWNE